MSIFAKIWAAIKAAVLAYPGGLAGVLGIIVALAARLGFHVTADQLMIIISVVSAVLGVFVHKATIAKARLPGGAAGLAPPAGRAQVGLHQPSPSRAAVDDGLGPQARGPHRS